MATSLQEANSIECRICHSKTTRDLIRSPCLCKGSMGFVHFGCLEHWLNISSHTVCELCSYKFQVITVRRYTLLQSIRAYLRRERQSLCMALLESLCGALFMVFLFLGFLILLYMVCFLWLTFKKLIFSWIENETVDTNDQDDGIIPPWKIALFLLPIFVVLSLKHCCIGAYKLIKRNYLAWYRFWNETVKVQLVLDLQNYKIIDNINKLNIQNTKLDKETEKSDQESLHEIKIVEKQSESKDNTRKTLNEEELQDFPFNNVKESSKSSQECFPEDKESYSKIESRPLHSSSRGVLIIPEVHKSHERKIINNYTDE